MKNQVKPNLKKQSKVARLLKVMSHPQRLVILCALADGEKSVGELTDISQASQSAVSQFLKGMRLEGLVKTRRDGQFVYCQIADKKVLALMQSLYKIFCD